MQIGIALALLIVLIAAGCAGRKPTVRRAPAPAPQPAPSETSTASRGESAPKPSVSNGAPAAPPGSYVEEGTASWYGVPFHGRRASNGEVYDMHKMTAAHRTLPFDSVVRVTNRKTGRSTEVRINDRGPFVEGRVIDLSMAAAQQIDVVGPGTAPVRIELISGPHPSLNQFTVQVGAFLQRDNAVKMRQSLERRYQPVFVVEFDSPKGTFHRVRVGRVQSEQAAAKLAVKLNQNDQLTTFVVRLDE